MKRSAFPVIALVAFAAQACTPLASPEPDFIPGCFADGLSDLVGQDASVLDQLDLRGSVRVIGPGMAITQDYSENRLNIDVNARNVITRVWCG